MKLNFISTITLITLCNIYCFVTKGANDSLIHVSINQIEKRLVLNSRDTSLKIPVTIRKGQNFVDSTFKTFRIEIEIKSDDVPGNLISVSNEVISFKNDSSADSIKLFLKADTSFHANSIRVVNISFTPIQGAEILKIEQNECNLLLTATEDVKLTPNPVLDALKELSIRVDSFAEKLTGSDPVILGEMAFKSKATKENIPVYKKRSCFLEKKLQSDDSTTVDSICINYSNGFFDALAYANGVIYKNKYPIPITKFNNPTKHFKKNYFSRLNAIYPPSSVGTFIVPQSFLIYSPKGRFLPADSIFTLKDSIGQKKIELMHNQNIDRLIDVKIYTDALGLSGKPNGLLQTEIQPRFTITKRRLVPWLPIVFLQNFSPGITITKFDSKFGQVQLNSDSSISNRLAPISQAYLIGSANLNLMKLGGISPTSNISFYIDLNFRIGSFKSIFIDSSIVDVVDTSGNTSHVQKTDTIENDSHFSDWGFEAAASIALSNRLSTDFTAKVWFNRISDYNIKSVDTYVYYTSSVRLNFITDSKVKTNRLFIRYRVGIANNWNNVFHQFEFGYSTSILNIFPKSGS